jgi:hypothetical protein
MPVSVVVVRDGGKCENAPAATARIRFRRLREIVHARRGLKRYGLRWEGQRNPITGIVRWRLSADPFVAEVRDAGLMSFCHVTLDDRSMPAMFKEEAFAGHGGVHICMLRGTQHVLALLDGRAALSERALEESCEP